MNTGVQGSKTTALARAADSALQQGLLLLTWRSKGEFEGEQQRRRGMHLPRCLQRAFDKMRAAQKKAESVCFSASRCAHGCWWRRPLFETPYLKTPPGLKAKAWTLTQARIPLNKQSFCQKTERGEAEQDPQKKNLLKGIWGYLMHIWLC